MEKKTNKRSSNRVTASSGGRQTTRRSSGSSRNGGGGKRRKKNASPYPKVAAAGVFLMIAITCVVWATKSIGKKAPVTETAEASTELVLETELQKEVTVDGIKITGMSRNEAREAILEQYTWDMKVSINETEYPVTNLIGEKLNLLLEEIFTGEPRETYSLDTSGLEVYVQAEVERIAAEHDVPAKNSALTGFDKETGFIYSQEVQGKTINRELLAADMNAVIQAKEFSTVLTARIENTQPELTMARAKEMYKVIGTFTTKTTSNKDRNTNIRIAAEAMDGLIIEPGQEFSFNKTTGNRTEKIGYRPAGAYVNGELVEEPGGGVCQVSSTLYNAVIFSGLKAVERHAHSYEPSYVTPGEDAMVSYDGYAGPDMRFLNNSKDTIAIRAKFADQTLTISIVGIPILESGVQVKMKSKKIADTDPPAPIYEEDQSLQPDVEKEVKAGTPGSRWETQMVTLKDGVVIKEELLHRSTYKGKPATIRRNTSGVVIPDESESAESTESTESTETIDPTESRPTETTESQTQSSRPTETQAPGPGGTTAPTEAETTKASQGPSETISPGNDGPGGQTIPSGPTDTGNIVAPNPMGNSGSMAP